MKARSSIIVDQATLASQKAEEVFRNPNATQEQKKAASDEASKAYGEYDKLLKEMEKHYQPDKTIWGTLKKRIMGGRQPAPAQGQAGAVPAGARPDPGMPGVSTAPGTPQPAPPPAGGGPSSAVTAQPANPYAAMMQGRQTAGEQEGRKGALQGQIDIGALQAKLRSQGASEAQAGGVAKIVTTHQMLSRGKIDLDQALIDVQDGAMKATTTEIGPKPGASQQAALDLLEKARLDKRFKDRIPEIDEKIAALRQGIAVKPGYLPRDAGAYKLSPKEREIAGTISGWEYSKTPGQQTPEVQAEWDSRNDQRWQLMVDASEALESQRRASAARSGRTGAGAGKGGTRNKWEVWSQQLRQYLLALQSGQGEMGASGVAGATPAQKAANLNRYAQQLLANTGEAVPPKWEGAEYGYIMQMAGAAHGGASAPAIPAPEPRLGPKPADLAGEVPLQ